MPIFTAKCSCAGAFHAIRRVRKTSNYVSVRKFRTLVKKRWALTGQELSWKRARYYNRKPLKCSSPSTHHEVHTLVKLITSEVVIVHIRVLIVHTISIVRTISAHMILELDASVGVVFGLYAAY